MTPRERVLATFEHESTDKVPIYHVGFSSQAASYILGREAYVGGGIQQWREARALWEGEAHREFLNRSLQDAFEVAKAVDNDIIRLFYWRLPEKPARKIDENTFLYGDPRSKYIIRRFAPSSELFSVVEEYPPRRKMTVSSRFEEAEKYVSQMEERLNSYHPRREDFQEINYLMKKHGKEYALRVDGGDVGIAIFSDPVWLMAMVSKPNLAARYLDVQAEIAVKQMRYFADAGVKLLFGGCDIASNHGPCFPPRVFRKLVLPRIRRVSEEAHRYGMYLLYGSDGNLWPVAEDLFGRSGVDGYYEIDRRAGMDLHKLRKRFPNLVLIGNISSHTLHLGAREEVIAETLSCLKDAKRSGAIIVGVSNYIVPGTLKENIKAMIETIRKYNA